MTALPEISVVIEWENVLLSDRARSESMLLRLARQIHDLQRSVEVIVVCDPADTGLAPLEALLMQRLGPADAGLLSWRLVEVSAAHYYELKNRGAAEAGGSLVVFIDSDVIPEHGWLAGLTERFEDPAVSVVAGHSYIDPQGLYSRAVALGWFFPLRSETSAWHEQGKHFFANNVAFRTAVLRSHPFPGQNSGATRGACTALARELIGQGIRICVTTAAQVAHPPPNGWRHFIVRAVADGRDEVLWWRHAEVRSRWELPLPVLRHYGKVALRAFRRIARHHRSVQLRLELVPLACLIMGAYYGAASAGAVLTWLAPESMSRRFRI